MNQSLFVAVDQQDEIEALRAERDVLQKQCEDWAEAMSRATERHDAKIEVLDAKHDARVTELLEANNREVERRRDAERIVTGFLDITTTSGEWLKDNASAVGALIDGRAAVVPLTCPDSGGHRTTRVGVEYWTDYLADTPTLWSAIDAVRLDKPVEGE